MKRDSIPLSVPNLGKAEIDEVSKTLLSGNLVQGKICGELESKFENYFGTKYAILVSNGTAALHLSLLSLGIGAGDEVIVPSYSFIASANAVKLTGANPVFVDLAKDQVNLDVKQISNLINTKTKAILVVHEFGLTADMKRILEIADQYGIHIVEDSACAFGSRAYGKLLGTHGVIGCFSFHPRKIITCGEGGLIITNDPEVANLIISLRNHGIKPGTTERSYVNVGFNYRMTEISASILAIQFSKLDEFIYRRNQIATRYLDEIKSPYIKHISKLPQETLNWQSFPILLINENIADLMLDYLKYKRISSIRPSQLIPSEPSFFANHILERDFPNSYEIWRKCIVIPMFETLSDLEISYIIEALNEFK